jgi:iron complex outermembrane receptor protein
MRFFPRALRFALIGSLAGHVPAGAEVLDLGSVSVGGADAATAALPPAPTQAPADVTQPTTRIDGAYIQDSLPASSSYDEIIRIAPSVFAASPDGPGLGDAASLTIRGFTDGQYNVTFDGIPFADADDFTHHTSAYFSAHDIASVTIDRGPGTASTIGNATFGGTVALVSRDPRQALGGAAYTSQGSFNTHLFGAELDSGPIATLNGGLYMLDGSHLQTDGALTNSALQRGNLFFKSLQPLGDNTVLTIVATTQAQGDHPSVGATRAQIAAYGPGFGLSGNPASQNDAAYNGETYRTDFEYVGVLSQLTDTLSLDNKLYTYGLFRHFGTGEDPNGETPNGTAHGATDVPGTLARNDLRAYGDILRLTDTLSFGTLRAGLWVEHQANARGMTEIDASLGTTLNPVLPGVATFAAIDRLQRETLDTVQPYVDLDWKITPALTLTAGLKFALFDRGVDAPVMEGTRLMLSTNVLYDAPLPALALRWQIAPQWSAYAQVARGFLAPQLQFLDVPDPKANPVAPEQTWNYQVGANWQGKPVALAADAYFIDFSNMVGSRTIGGVAQVFDEGAVHYAGLEAEGTVSLGRGFSLYGNGSVNSARQVSDGAPAPNTPQATVVGGIVYGQGDWHGSLLDKWVGSRYGDTERQQGLDPFNQLDFSVSWQPKPTPVKLQVQALNLLDSRKIIALAGYTLADQTPLFYTQPGRSVFVGATVTF